MLDLLLRVRALVLRLWVEESERDALLWVRSSGTVCSGFMLPPSDACVLRHRFPSSL